MRNQEIIKSAKNFVRNALEEESSGHDYWHCIRVWENAKNITQKEGGNQFVIELAAILHDVDDWKITGNDFDGTPKRALKFLNSIDISEEKVNLICTVIESIDFKNSLSGKGPESLEAKIVYDADKLDSIGATGIARAFAFGGDKHRPMFNPEIFPVSIVSKQIYTTWDRETNTSVNHFFEKLLKLKNNFFTETAKQEAAKRHLFMVNFLKQFFGEQNNSKWVLHLDKFLQTII